MRTLQVWPKNNITIHCCLEVKKGEAKAMVAVEAGGSYVPVGSWAVKMLFDSMFVTKVSG